MRFFGRVAAHLEFYPRQYRAVSTPSPIWGGVLLTTIGPAEDEDSKVLLDFVETAVDPITDAQTVLDTLAVRNVDSTRVGVRIVGNPNSVATLPTTAWNAKVIN